MAGRLAAAEPYSSREHLVQAQRLAHLGSAEVDTRTGVQLWSDEMYRILGFEPGGVEPDFDVMRRMTHQDDRAALDEVRRRTVAGENVPLFSFRILRPDGEIRWLRRHAEIMRDDAGNMTGFIVSILDETDRKRAEIELHERDRQLSQSLAQLARAQRLAQLGSIEYDMRAGVSRWTREVWHILGIDPSAPADFATFWNTIHPADRPVVEAAYRSIQNGVQPPPGEVRVVRPDGEVRWIYRLFELQRDAGGAAREMVTTLVDITERKRSEAELRRNQEELQRIREHLSEAQRVGGIGSVEFEIGLGNRFWSDEFYRVLGLEPGVIAPSIDYAMSRVHPDDRAMVADLVGRSHWGAESAATEFRILRPSGETRWVRRQQAFRRDSAGSPVTAVVTWQDVTERKRFERELSDRAAELRESRENLIFAQRVGRMGSAAIDVRTGKSTWSEQMYALLGLDPATTTPGAEAFLALVHPDEREAVRSRRDGWMAGHHHELRECRVIRPTGEHIWVQTQGEILAGEDGEPSKVIMTFQDITELKRAQMERADLERQLGQAQKMEAVGRLTGGIAHDFNNLLSVVMGRLTMLEDELGDRPELREWVRVCLKAANRGAALTRSMLAFARQQPLQPIDTDVVSVLNDLMGLLSRTLGESVEVRVEYADSQWRCEVDPGQLQHALLNLAINARDAMPEGGKLSIVARNARLDEDYAAAHGYVRPGDYVMLSVSDTGVGMAPEIRERVFEPFFTTKEVGSGLGLSMVYGFVKQSGGHVHVYSEPGLGTTVRIYLPRSVAIAASEERNPAGSPKGNETILVVEDDEDMRDLAIAMLRKLGYSVLSAGIAAEALTVLATTPEIALLLTDVTLPGGMNGHVLAQQAVAARPGLKVLYMSGYPRDAISLQGRLDPGVRLLKKPFDSQELAGAIRAMLDAG